ncbi:hypothetical protein KIW84_055303 [Lathyrus oleraceus]|uniref:Hydroxyproline O-arabinosyltransferase-like domain-containing protein n=1 Tax=Pisum sativum TaxID=3888 RepID=A0A9D4X018_PEA|nr:hypothetical protein KIW84_055303 [Pisum sativum]
MIYLPKLLLHCFPNRTQLPPHRRNIQEPLCDSSMIPPDFSVGQDYQVIPLADLEGVLDPQPELLDALVWEPEYDVGEKNVWVVEMICNLVKTYLRISAECMTYFDWKTVGFMHSFRLSGQPGNVTRLLSCSSEDLMKYKGHDLVPTHSVPSMSRHPLTGDWYPAVNKPSAVIHWLNHVKIDVEYIVILDADMIMRGQITPREFKASRSHLVSTPYDYLIGCDNELAKLHTNHPLLSDVFELCKTVFASHSSWS